MSDAVVGQTEEGAFRDRVLMFTDVEESSRRWDVEPDVMRELMRHHDALVTANIKDATATANPMPSSPATTPSTATLARSCLVRGQPERPA